MERLFTPAPEQSPDALQRPFGAASRAQMLAAFLGDSLVAAENAWKELYRLLLWIDRTTGLAHCYESDKAQPGRPWYERSLAFHAWVSDQLGVPEDELGTHIDRLFRSAMHRLLAASARQRAQREGAMLRQLAPFAERNMPQPGADPGLAAILNEAARAAGGGQVPPDGLLAAVQAIDAYYAAENKRKNLLGEGFEDSLAAVMQRLPGGGPPVVDSRKLLHELPGFREPPAGEKPRRVDLGIVRSSGERVLVSVKWSVRADREEQFGVDYDAYARMEVSGLPFRFVLITNEFDAARLRSASHRRVLGRSLFDEVVHVCPEAVLTTYGTSQRGAASELPDLVAAGRIVSLGDWLAAL